MNQLRLWRGALLGLALIGLATPAFGASKGEKALKKALASGDAAAVASAIEQLGDEDTEKAAKTILQVALNADALSKSFTASDTNAIFDTAEGALAGMSDKKALKYVFKNAQKNRDYRARVILVMVCGVKDDPDAEEAVVSSLTDKHGTVATTAARVLGSKRKFYDPGKAMSALIEVLGATESDRREPWQDVLLALNRLTGEEIATAQEWQEYWKVAADKFDPSRPRTGTVGGTVSRNAPKLFGKEILSKRVVFILDVSGSMALKDPSAESGRKGAVSPKEPDYNSVPKERMRLERLKEAMIAAIKELPGDTKFTIVTFATNIKNWEKDLVMATAKNKANAVDFSRGMVAQGFTRTDEALERAFEVEGANTFYLFSDGIPQRDKNQKIDRQEILDKVKAWNRTRKVRLYTIGIGEADRGFMTQLATENGGDFTAVD